MAAVSALVAFIACGGKEKTSTQQRVPAPAIQSFTASPDAPITLGGSATLLPVFTDGQGVVQPGAISAASGVSIQVSPASNTTYTLQVTNSANVTASATVKVLVDTASTIVGTAGAILKSPTGATVEVPRGALDRDTSISISATNQPPPAGLETVSPVYRFEPSGIVFARPVKVSLPLPTGVSSGAIYWSRSGGGTSAGDYDSIGGTISKGVISAEIPHFSLAVIGAGTPTRTVIGVGQTTWISATTRESVPVDFSSLRVEAIVNDPNGNRITLPAIAGALPGTFSIPGVPDGNYILRTGRIFLVTSTSSPDLGGLSGGRPDAQRTPVTAPTLLNVNLTGLAPWANDSVEFYVTEENDWDFSVERFFSPPPATGSTSVSFVFDLSRASGSPASTIHAAGDHVFFSQLSSRVTDSGVPYSLLTRIAPLDPFDLADGASATVTASMVDVSASNALTVDYRGTQWNALMSDGNPAGTNRRAFLGVFAQPGSADDGIYSNNASLLSLSPRIEDMVIGPINYGSPTDTTLAGNWGPLLFADFHDDIRFILPGTQTAGIVSSRVFWLTTPEEAQAAPLTPPVSMPLNVTVAVDPTSPGVPFFTADPNRIISGIGLTPTIAWSPPRIPQPASGRPLLYVLRLLNLVAIGSRTVVGVRSIVTTPELSFSFPAGILTPGATHVFTLTATASTVPGAARQIATAPFKTGNNFGEAATVSSRFTP